MTSAGGLTLSTGTTAQRPVSPGNGTFRYNSNATSVEYYANSAWSYMPQFANTIVSSQNIILPNGYPTGSMLYWKDPDTYNKTLSVMMLGYNFAVATAYNNTWLQVDPSITGATVGYVTPVPITLTIMTGFTDAASNKTISLFVEDTEYTNRMTFTSTGDLTDSATSAPVNIDVAVGQKIRLRVKSSSIQSLGSIVCNLYFMMRK